jgi:hypothetical protein
MKRKTSGANQASTNGSPFKPKWPRTVWKESYRLPYLDQDTERIAQRFDRLYECGNLSDHDRGQLILVKRQFSFCFKYRTMAGTLHTDVYSQETLDDVIAFLDELEARYAGDLTDGV